MKKILLILALLIAMPVSAASYNIQVGDTLSKIAANFNSTVTQLLQLNQHIDNADLIYAGDTLEVPSAIRGADLYYRPVFGGGAGIPITDYETTLTTSLTSTATTINVASITTTDNHVLTTADISPAIYLVLDSDSSTKKEIVKCTTISSTSFTGCTRGLAFYGAESSVAANKKSHSAGSMVVLSDVHLLFVSLNAEQSWTRIQTFNIYPESGVGANPTTTWQFAPKGYVDGVAIQGGVTSTEALTGIVQLGTPTEVASSTFDAEEPTVVATDTTTSTPTYSCDSSGTAGALCIPVAENDGKLSQTWLDLTEAYTFTGDMHFASTTFTASTTWDILPEYDSDPIGNDEAVRKSYVDSFNPNAVVAFASDTLQASSDTAVGVSGPSYLLKKQINFYREGVVRVTFDLKSNGSSLTYARIYKNDVAVGTERSTTSASYTTYSEDLSFTAGDEIQIYMKTDGGGTITGVQNFRLYFTETTNTGYVVIL